MVSPQARFYLRLETGDRAGEVVPIPDEGLAVGRRPENALRLAEASVSGRHAELSVEGGGVTLRDLGSTNGTKVGDEKVTERRLAHGDSVAFGSLRCTFVDSALADAGPAAGSDAGEAATAGAGDAVATITTDRVAKTSRKGIWGVLVVLVLLAVAAGAALQLMKGGGESSAAGTPVADVPGNRIEDHSFEAVDAPVAWEDADLAPAAFYRDASFRTSGATGLGADLAAGEWARVRSPELTVRQRRSNLVRAELAVEGDASACLGFELASSDGARAPMVAWSEVVRGEQSVELVVAGVAGYDVGRVVVEGRSEGGDGSVAVDDVVVLEEADAAPPAATFEEYTVRVFGGRTAVVVRAGAVRMGGIRVRESAGAGLPRWPVADLSAAQTGNGVRFTVAGAPAGAELAMHAELSANGGSGGDGDVGAGVGWIATTGPEGFRRHAGGFEDVRATGLLLGQGIDLMRLGFAEPVLVSVARADGAVRLTFRAEDMGGSLAGFDLQLAFGQERGEARTLAGTAQDLERRGDPGAALATWSDLLDRYPFDAELVAQASAARARLLGVGHEEIIAVRQELERARFFDLGDLYRLCRRRAVAIGERYGASEVADEAGALVAEIDAELAAFDSARDAARDGRLQAVLDVVEGKDWSGLAGRVRAALDEERPQ